VQAVAVEPAPIGPRLVSTPSRQGQRRDLIWTLIRTEFKARYHETMGGFLWALVKPLMIFVVLMSVFSFIFASDPVYKRNLILGLFLWDFFAEGTKIGIISMYSKSYLLTKAKLPAWIIVVTSASNALITLIMLVVVILAFLGFGGMPPTAAGVLLFFAYIAALVLMVSGISLAGSVLFLRYRDINQVWDVVTQAGFFVAPIIYPLSILPERFHFYLYIWPPTPVIQFSRAVLVNHSVPTLKAHALLAFMALTIFGAGALIHRRYAPRAIEYL
jgi:lipopolysaccharide transport system permease protein